MPCQILISVIAAGGNPAAAAAPRTRAKRTTARRNLPAPEVPTSPAPSTLAAETAASTPEKLLADALDAIKANNYAKAAQSLIAVADMDRLLIMQNPAEDQVKQAPVKQKYANALKLATQGNDAAMQFKALSSEKRCALTVTSYSPAPDSRTGSSHPCLTLSIEWRGS